MLGSLAEQERIRTLEHAVYRPGASVDAERELSGLLAQLREQAEALDRAVEESGIRRAGGVSTNPSVAQPDSGSQSLQPPPRRRGRLTPTRIVIAALAVVALAAVAGTVVQASAPRPSLDVFTEPADPADEGRSDFVTQVLQEGVMGTGPVRYLGEQHGVRVFAALVGDTFHNPDDPQEGVCLTGFVGSDRLASSTTNCALRSDFDRNGVAVFFTQSSSGELQSSATIDATRALVWGPTGGLREVAGDELAQLIAVGCSDDLSFRAREDCAR